jgi:hypothetical protein
MNEEATAELQSVIYSEGSRRRITLDQQTEGVVGGPNGAAARLGLARRFDTQPLHPGDQRPPQWFAIGSDQFGAALNTPETLRKWIQDPSSINPGTTMPAF